jgi:hypothetical protein
LNPRGKVTESRAGRASKATSKQASARLLLASFARASGFCAKARLAGLCYPRPRARGGTKKSS